MIVITVREFKLVAPKDDRVRRNHEGHRLADWRLTIKITNNNVERPFADFLIDYGKELFVAAEIDSAPKSGVERIGPFLYLISNTYQGHAG
jgi:hypothetical protein